MGFTKLDEGIVFSSIMSEDDSVFKVWTILLATCKQDGVSPISSSFIEKITSKDELEIERCLNVLSSPDKKSRSQNDDGCRIRKVDGGFFVINYEKYREFTYSDNPESVRKREYRKKTGHSGTCPGHSASASAYASDSSGKREREGEGISPSIDEEPRTELEKTFLVYSRMREKINKPMDKEQAEIVMKKLQEFAKNDDSMKIKILEQSIVSQWPGVFPLGKSQDPGKRVV